VDVFAIDAEAREWVQAAFVVYLGTALAVIALLVAIAVVLFWRGG